MAPRPSTPRSTARIEAGADARRARPAAGRKPSPTSPALTLRAIGVALSPSEREFMRSRTLDRLRRFTTRILRVQVRLTDESGPKGAPTVSCRLTITVRRQPDVVVEQRAPAALDAFHLAIDRTERAVRRTLQRHRELRRE